MSSHRMEQVNELLRVHISTFFARDIEFPQDVFITLSRVETTRDLKHAKVLVSVIPDNKRGTGLRVLKKYRSRLQKYVSSKVKMKFTPAIHFGIDSQEVYGNEVDRILDSLEIKPEIKEESNGESNE